MASLSAMTVLAVLLLAGVFGPLQICSGPGVGFGHALEEITRPKNLEKRSLLAFPPSSLLQINMGITLAGQLQNNAAIVVLAFQQNAPLPNETQPFLSPSVVAARKFSVYDHLRDVVSSYGFDGFECLKKMICQIGETPLLGGIMEDVITFVLSPSRHRSVLHGGIVFDKKRQNYINLLLESEQLGKLGGNCTLAFPQCFRTPLDLISTLTDAED